MCYRVINPVVLYISSLRTTRAKSYLIFLSTTAHPHSPLSTPTHPATLDIYVTLGLGVIDMLKILLGICA